MKSLVALNILILTAIYSCNNETNKKVNSENNETPLTSDTVGLSASFIESLHERKTLKNYDMSLVDFINSQPNKPDSTRKVVYILPFGNMKPQVEEIIKAEVEYLEIFLQLPVKVMSRVGYDEIKEMETVKTRKVPDSDYDYFSKMKGEITSFREQIEANSFINSYLIDHKPKDAVAVLGITEHDIYKPDYNFLFGTSNRKSAVGLVSTFRLIDYGQQTKWNIRKVVSKQIVNLFSIRNVKDYVCLLNFHNNKDELVFGEFKLSPLALSKLRYCIGFDYQKRFMQLEEFWRMEANTDMAEYYQRCIELIPATEATKKQDTLLNSHSKQLKE